MSFVENRSRTFFMLDKGFCACYHRECVKIYYFSKNNTEYDIVQKIILPEELQNSILYPFNFMYNNDFYFF